MNDLLIRRGYTVGGITVVVEIDFVKKTISLVENDGELKEWIFGNRTLEYMNGWRNIFAAMDYATTQAANILKEADNREHERFVKLLMEVDKKLPKSEWKLEASSDGK